MPDDANITGYELPLHTALTQPPLFGGVPRILGILNLTLTFACIFGLRLWVVAPVLGVAIHLVAIPITKHDPMWLDVFRRHLNHPNHFDT